MKHPLTGCGACPRNCRRHIRGANHLSCGPGRGTAALPFWREAFRIWVPRPREAGERCPRSGRRGGSSLRKSARERHDCRSRVDRFRASFATGDFFPSLRTATQAFGIALSSSERRDHARRLARKSFRNCIHALFASRIIPASSSREPGAHRVSGRAAVTSHRGSGSTVLRAPDRPACPVETASISVGSAPEADGAPYVPRRKWPWDVCPAECGDRHRTGGRWKRSFLLRIRARFNCPPVFPPSSKGQMRKQAWQ